MIQSVQMETRCFFEDDVFGLLFQKILRIEYLWNRILVQSNLGALNSETGSREMLGADRLLFSAAISYAKLQPAISLSALHFSMEICKNKTKPLLPITRMSFDTTIYNRVLVYIKTLLRTTKA